MALEIAKKNGVTKFEEGGNVENKSSTSNITAGLDRYLILRGA